MRSRLLIVQLALAVMAALAVTIVALPTMSAAVPSGQLDVFVQLRDGQPIVGAEVQRGSVLATTDSVGRARLSGIGPGAITVSHPIQPDRTVRWLGDGDRMVIVLASPVRRAVHIAGTLPGTTRWQELLTLADQTSLNAVMIDMKDESGRVFPTSSSAWGALAGSVLSRWEMSAVVDEAHAHDLAVITRIVTFQDPVAGRALPEMAVWNRSTGGPYQKKGQYFLDPTDPDARDYALELAREACTAGVDEVQFDYVRFPDGNLSNLRFDGGSGADVRVATITGFLADARATLPRSCDVGADVFGFITSIDNDVGIGQQLTSLAGVIDVVSPMVYPNHWGAGWFGFSVPANHPGEVVDGSSRNGLARLGDSTTVLRPWLQDFGGYGPTEVRAQIDAADALGLGWLIWNAGSRFSEAGIPTDTELLTPGDPPLPIVESLPASGFWDVPPASKFGPDITWLRETGITHGCNPPWRDEFCPRRMLSRGEAAAMLSAALNLPAATVDHFDDDNGSTHESGINALAEAGITRGCGLRIFCPSSALTRAQMAALIAQALDLPDVVANTFDDDDGLQLESDIERIAAVGITNGCGLREFCPGEPVLREQVAAFLYRARAS